jgi:hypothetical protein
VLGDRPTREPQQGDMSCEEEIVTVDVAVVISISRALQIAASPVTRTRPPRPTSSPSTNAAAIAYLRDPPDQPERTARGAQRLLHLLMFAPDEPVNANEP